MSPFLTFKRLDEHENLAITKHYLVYNRCLLMLVPFPTYAFVVCFAVQLINFVKINGP